MLAHSLLHTGRRPALARGEAAKLSSFHPLSQGALASIRLEAGEGLQEHTKLLASLRVRVIFLRMPEAFLHPEVPLAAHDFLIGATQRGTGGDGRGKGPAACNFKDREGVEQHCGCPKGSSASSVIEDSNRSG